MAGYPKPGETFGRYQVVRQIGRGGMGAVFEVVDPALQRSVALKIVNPELADDEHYRERFAREAAVLAQLRSRHILQIHEYGHLGEAVYLITEYFPDGDLQMWLTAHGALDRLTALTLVAQVCEGLHDAHEVGVVHRDVKPSNVLLWRRKGHLIPFLCDFGIATTASQRLTRTGMMIGSLPYMAPERHVGEPADHRGDIYSAGCLLLAALTGQAPYSGTDFHVMEAHLRGPIPQIVPTDDLDVAINAILARALQKNPNDRYPDAAAMAADIDRLIPPGARSQEPISVERPAVLATPTSAPPIAPTAGEPTAPAPGQQPVTDQSSELTLRRPVSNEMAVMTTYVPTAPPPPPPGAAPAGPAEPGRGRWIALVAVVALIAAGGIGWLLLTGGSDDNTPSAAPAEPTTSASAPTPSPTVPTETETAKPHKPHKPAGPQGSIRVLKKPGRSAQGQKCYQLWGSGLDVSRRDQQLIIHFNARPRREPRVAVTLPKNGTGFIETEGRVVCLGVPTDLAGSIATLRIGKVSTTWMLPAP